MAETQLSLWGSGRRAVEGGHLDELRAVLRPLFLRRTKEQVESQIRVPKQARHPEISRGQPRSAEVSRGQPRCSRARSAEIS